MSRDPFAHKEGTLVVEILDCTSWQPYRGIPEGSGRSEKQWLVSDDGRIGLFKFPRVDPVSHSVTYEHVSEHLAHRIGTQLDVETATVDIATYQGRIGSLSHLITNENESLLEGLHFILGKHPDFEQETLRFSKTNEYYSIKCEAAGNAKPGTPRAAVLARRPRQLRIMRKHPNPRAMLKCVTA